MSSERMTVESDSSGLAGGAVDLLVNNAGIEKPFALTEIAWLAGPEAEYVTGTTVFVDGGMTLYPGFV